MRCQIACQSLMVVLLALACHARGGEPAESSEPAKILNLAGSADTAPNPFRTETDPTLFPAASSDGTTEACPGIRGDACPRWYASAEWLLLARTNGAFDQPIVIDYQTDTALLSTQDLDFNYSSGMRMTVGRRIGCSGRAIEFSYLGWFDGQSSASAHGSPTMTLPFDLGPASNVFYGADPIRVHYNSWLSSYELNFPCCCGCCEADCSGCSRCRSVEWFAGFRYLRLNEEMTIAGQRVQNNAMEYGLYDLETTNDLFGVQLGGRLRRTYGRWGWEATGKAGLFGNAAEQNQYVLDYPNTYLRSPVGEDHGNLAFLGELNLTGIYRLTDVWGLRAGYNLIWLTGVALAPNQLDFTNTSSSGALLSSNHGFLLHGFNFGVEARW